MFLIFLHFHGHAHAHTLCNSCFKKPTPFKSHMEKVTAGPAWTTEGPTHPHRSGADTEADATLRRRRGAFRESERWAPKRVGAVTTGRRHEGLQDFGQYTRSQREPPRHLGWATALRSHHPQPGGGAGLPAQVACCQSPNRKPQGPAAQREQGKREGGWRRGRVAFCLPLPDMPGLTRKARTG